MKSFNKKILAGVLAGTLLFAGCPVIYAAPKGEPPQHQEKVDLNQLAKDFAEQYGINEKDVLAALKEGRAFDDISYAAIFAKVSGKSFNQVLSMKADWFDVMRKLGITREKYEETVRDLLIEDIATRSELDNATVKKLMEAHYFPRDIRIAGRLAKASGKDVQTILDMKKINMRWLDVAKELNVDQKLVRPRNAAEEQEDAQTDQPQDGEQPQPQE